jgi:hypothetical protein
MMVLDPAAHAARRSGNMAAVVAELPAQEYQLPEDLPR